MHACERLCDGSFGYVAEGYAYPIPASPAEVWFTLPSVFEALQIEPVAVDSNSLLMGKAPEGGTVVTTLLDAYARPRDVAGNAENQFTSQKGQATAEFLLVLPVLVFLIFGIIEMGAAMRTYQAVTHTAREGARLTSLPGPVINCSWKHGRVHTSFHPALRRRFLEEMQFLCLGVARSGETGFKYRLPKEIRTQSRR